MLSCMLGGLSNNVLTVYDKFTALFWLQRRHSQYFTTESYKCATNERNELKILGIKFMIGVVRFCAQFFCNKKKINDMTTYR